MSDDILNTILFAWQRSGAIITEKPTLKKYLIKQRIDFDTPHLLLRYGVPYTFYTLEGYYDIKTAIQGDVKIFLNSLDYVSDSINLVLPKTDEKPISIVMLLEKECIISFS